MMRRALFAPTFLALACVSSSTSTDTAADDQALRAAMETLNQAISSRNDSLIASLYAEDAVLMPPGQPRVVGREAIRASWASDWALNGSLTITPDQFVVSGDWAWGDGTWSSVQPSAGGELRDHGKQVNVWHRIEGNWMLTRDIWNSDAPTPATTPTQRN